MWVGLTIHLDFDKKFKIFYSSVQPGPSMSSLNSYCSVYEQANYLFFAECTQNFFYYFDSATAVLITMTFSFISWAMMSIAHQNTCSSNLCVIGKNSVWYTSYCKDQEITVADCHIVLVYLGAETVRDT